MKKHLYPLAIGALTLALAGNVTVAQDENDGDAWPTAYPVELYSCKYHEGKGPADLDEASTAFNQWADERKVSDYTAWTLVPFYSSSEQDFDFIWIGTSPTATAMGRVQDDWLATGADAQTTLGDVMSCDAHVNFATLQVKAPPQRELANIVISFSDCNMPDGVGFGEVAPALGEWSEYIGSQGSQSGMWVLFPAYGGGGEEFDFKLVSAHANLEEQGNDWDQYSKEGWAKAEELFTGKLECDSSRVYMATRRRQAAGAE